MFRCSGELKLTTALAFFQYRFSDSLSDNPPLISHCHGELSLMVIRDSKMFMTTTFIPVGKLLTTPFPVLP